MLKVTCPHCNKRGHEEWLCYDKHDMHTSSPNDRRKWGREQALAQKGRDAPRVKDESEKRARVDDGSNKASAVFRQRRQG